MAVTRGLYKRWYGTNAERIAMNATKLCRITDEFYCTDTKAVWWWDGAAWNQIH